MKSKYSLTIHKLINDLPVFNWESIDDIIYKNGIYFVFENGEEYGEYRRIVRVGSHIAQNRLKLRLKDHFEKCSHCSSIFIKNIGRVYLNQKKDPYIKYWNITKPSKLSAYERKVYYENKDRDKEKQITDKAASYLQENMSFSVIGIDDKNIRLEYETAIIASLCKDDDFKASSNWLGNDSPEPKIRKSGMWVSQGINAEPLTPKKMEQLVNIIENSIHEQ